MIIVNGRTDGVAANQAQTVELPGYASNTPFDTRLSAAQQLTAQPTAFTVTQTGAAAPARPTRCRPGPPRATC